MLFLAQPSQFILAWNRHQIYWLAYLVALKHKALILTSGLVSFIHPFFIHNITPDGKGIALFTPTL